MPIDFRLERGARHALIGPNGAGKTTFVNLVTGALAAERRADPLDGADITDLPQAAAGQARARPHLSDHRAVPRPHRARKRDPGGRRAARASPAICCARPGSIARSIEEAFALLEQLGLADDALRPVSALAYGRQRLVEIAVALGLAPKVLLLDEPAAGVPSGESGTIIEVIERLPPDIALLIIEHDMDLVFRLARRITVLVQGASWSRARRRRSPPTRECARSISASAVATR